MKTRHYWIVLIAFVCSPTWGQANRELLLEAEQTFAQGRTEQALVLVDGYIREAPDDPKGYLLRAAMRAAGREWERSLADYDKAISLDAKQAGAYQRRGVARFMAGRIKESLADFDKYLGLRPEEKPGHWQRGIALYYAGKYEEGAKQFELHRTVNPADVENAAWHFLCVARSKGVDAARAGLIPIKGDDRVPMAKIHEMFAGRASVEDVIAAAKAGAPLPAQLNRQLFYAHLYAGLYCESIAKGEEAMKQMRMAVEHDVPDYMHGVAVLHVKLRSEGKRP